MILRRLAAIMSLAGVALTFSTCVSSIDPGVELSSEISDDRDYYKSYQGATRGGDIIKNFGLDYRIHATYLYPEFRTQLAKRLSRLYLQDAGAFTEADSKSGFFVTVFGSERDSTDLSNTNHWTILLEGKEASMRPVLVRKITDKKRWRNFFETISPWSTEYLVVFDTAAANPGAATLVEAPHIKLVIASARGKMTMDW
jgi:hypothetical protein